MIKDKYTEIKRCLNEGTSFKPKVWAWVIVAQPIIGYKEGQEHVVAIFDTKRKASQYERKARLPIPHQGRLKGGPWRYYKEASLLWDYCPLRGLLCDGHLLVVPIRYPGFKWSCPENPKPVK